MKVLVLNPSSKVTKNVVRDVLYGCWCKGKRIGGGTVPPFALLSVATVLETNGIDTEFIDASAEQMPYEEQLNLIPGFDIVVISTSTMSFVEDTGLLEQFKKVNNDLQTIIFGSHPTFMTESSLNPDSVDFAVVGEPEEAILKLVKEIINNGRPDNIPGIAFKDNGKFTINKVTYIENLDTLPFLNVDKLPNDIHYFNPIVKRMPYITTTASRGCPGKCTFCTAPFFYGSKIRFKSDDVLLDEMEFYSGKGYKEIYFRDETFIIKNKRDKEFCKKLIERNLDLTWLCNCRVGMVSKEDMHYMKRSGCHLIKIGVESGVQEILDNVKKGIRVEETRETFKNAADEGLETHAHVMLGMPGENKDTLKRTIDFILEINPTTATFGICTPYPGSPLFNEVLEKYPEIKDGSDTNLGNLHTQAVYNKVYTELGGKELEKAVQTAYRKFYLRPVYFFRTLKRIKSLDDIKRFMLAGTQVIDFALHGD